jgi:hypothetical protein
MMMMREKIEQQSNQKAPGFRKALGVIALGLTPLIGMSCSSHPAVNITLRVDCDQGPYTAAAGSLSGDQERVVTLEVPGETVTLSARLGRFAVGHEPYRSFAAGAQILQIGYAALIDGVPLGPDHQYVDGSDAVTLTCEAPSPAALPAAIARPD